MTAHPLTSVPSLVESDAATAEAVVRAHELTKRFGAGTSVVEALRGVDVGFFAGTFTAIMGPSGSGKSTLLHILAGLDRPTGGWVEIAGERLDRLNDRDLTLLRRRQVGFVFQSYNLLPVLTAEENITLPLRIAGLKPDKAWVDEVLGRVGLSDRRDHRPAELSGGQQQRVAIARALISRPAVVFADEPTGNLDSTASEEVLEMLRGSVDELGGTVVMVTHDPRVAAYGDRVVVLVDGRIESDSTVEGADQVQRLMQAV
jgi:putative ABC transport system ATP-binding protein